MRNKEIEGGDAHAEALLAEQLRLLARQVRRSPYAVFFVASSIVFGVYEYVTPWMSFGWLGLVLLSLLARRAFAGRVLRGDTKAEARTDIGKLAAFAGLNGAAIGLSAPLFFWYLPDTARAIVSMVLVGLAAGGIATSAAYRPAFTAYVLPALVPLAISWMAVGSTQRMLIGVLVIVFAAMLFTFVRENHQLLFESVSIRFEREKLLLALEAQNQDVRAAVERAEEAGRAKARVLAAASHDLRQPLYALSLYSAVLARNPTQETLNLVSQHIELSVRSLGALLNALLDLSRLDAGVFHISLSTFDLLEVLQRVFGEYQEKAKEKGLNLILQCESVPIYSDPIVVERIVRNLIDNAVKYTDHGSVEISAMRVQYRVVVAIKDSGKGIPESEQERVFEEFYQLDNPGRDREQGLGLGLSIVKRLAELIGSGIALDSRQGEGSTFSMSLSAAHVVAAPRVSAVPPESDNIAGACILLIDDESSVRHAMTLLVESWGAHLYAAGDLSAAERVMEHRSGAVDLIIADLRLQDGADGLSAVQSLRQRWGDIPVMLASGETDPAKLKDAVASGFSLFHKPVPQEILRKGIASQLQK